MTRLQFKRVLEVFNSRSEAINYIETNKTDVSNPNRAALYGEPILLRYRNNGSLYVMLAMGVDDDENIFTYLDLTGSIVEIESKLNAIEVDIDDINNLIDSIQYTLSNEVVTSVTPSDNSINIGGTIIEPTVGLRIDDTASKGNVELSVTSNGLTADIDLTDYVLSDNLTTALDTKTDVSVTTALTTRVDNVEDTLDTKIDSIIGINGINVGSPSLTSKEVGIRLNPTQGNVSLTASNSGLSGAVVFPDQFITGVDPSDNVISVDVLSNIKTDIRMEYNNVDKKIYLYGKNDYVISEIDATYFFSDSSIDSASYNPLTKELEFVINRTDGTQESVAIDMSELVDTYYAGQGIEIGSDNYINVKLDPSSENYLSVGDNGLKLQGVITLVRSEVDVEKNRALAAEGTLTTALNTKITNLTSTSKAIAVDATNPLTPSLNLIIDDTVTKGNINLSVTNVGLTGDIDLGDGLKIDDEKALSVNVKDGIIVDTDGAMKLDSNISDLVNYYTKTEADAITDLIDSRVSANTTRIDELSITGETNVIESISVNDVNIAPDASKNVNISVVTSVNTRVGDVVLNATDVGAYTKAEIDTKTGEIDNDITVINTTLDNIVSNVQGDWTETNVDDEAFIKNKPTNLVTTPSLTTILENYVTDSELTAIDTRLDTAEGEIDDLQSKVGASVVNSVTAADKSISIGGTLSNPSVSVKIDTTATAGNVLLTVTDEGLKGSVNITQFQIKVVDTLPAVGESLYYYLLKTATADVYEEYVWAEVEADVFEFIKLGDTSVGLAGYVTTEDLNNALATKANVTDLNNLTSRVTTNEGDIIALETSVSNLSTELDDKMDITNTYDRTAIDTKVNAKADASTVTLLDGRVDTLEVKVTALEGAEANVQVDWSETDVDSDAFILNKPTIPSIDGLATTESVNAGLALKANVADVYTKTQVYNKTEIDTAVGTVNSNVTTVDNKVTAINTRLTTAEGDITTIEGDVEANTTKLNTIESGAEVNIIEVVQVDSVALPIVNKTVDIDLTPYQKKVVFVTMTAPTAEYTLLPNTYYEFTGLVSSLSLKLGGTELNNEYIFKFSTANSIDKLTVIDSSGANTIYGIRALKADKIYEVSILNKLALMAEIDNTI